MERLERRIFRLLDRKTLIDVEDAVELFDKYYKDMVNKIRTTERALVRFYEIVSME
jgi:hypothetical protein